MCREDGQREKEGFASWVKKESKLEIVKQRVKEKRIEKIGKKWRKSQRGQSHFLLPNFFLILFNS